jgi:Protein of unknown function (DUF1326)
MKKVLFVILAILASMPLLMIGAEKPASAPEWSINATAIEACSCPMFCQCYFNTKPAGHHNHGSGESEHYCRANIAYMVNKGNYGSLKLDGLKFWLTSDLGADFSKGQMDWTILTFDKSMTKEQRDAIQFIYAKLFPVKWNSMTTSEGVIDSWKFDKDTAVATLDGGKTAEIHLKRFPGMTDSPVVITNLKYFGAPRNDGFVLMPNELQAYRVGPKAFEFKNSNGFMITVDMKSKDLAPASGGGL